MGWEDGTIVAGDADALVFVVPVSINRVSVQRAVFEPRHLTIPSADLHRAEQEDDGDEEDEEECHRDPPGVDTEYSVLTTSFAAPRQTIPRGRSQTLRL